MTSLIIGSRETPLGAVAGVRTPRKLNRARRSLSSGQVQACQPIARLVKALLRPWYEPESDETAGNVPLRN
jgi:hypothetical protein